jgi:hypothetical protein
MLKGVIEFKCFWDTRRGVLQVYFIFLVMSNTPLIIVAQNDLAHGVL